MDKPTIKQLVAMTDAELSEFFGLSQKLEVAKEELKKLDQLEGKARDLAEERLQEMLTPNLYPEDLGYLRQEARRKARLENTAEEELQDATPDILD